MRFSHASLLASLWAVLSPIPIAAPPGGRSRLTPLVGIHRARPPAPALWAGVTAFVDVTVVPMDRERVLPHQTVLVQGTQITALGPVRRVTIPAGAVRIDGRGKFLIPGLADMHTHVGEGDSAAAERALVLWLANGVTTIRNVDYGSRTDPNAPVLRLRARAAAGTIVSPRIYTSGGGSWFEGSPYGHHDARLVAQEVAAYKAAGYDFIKVHEGENAPTLDSLFAVGHRLGLPIVGHLPPYLTVEQVLQKQPGYTSIEHLSGYVRALKRQPDVKIGEGSINQSAAVFLQAMQQGLDVSRIPALAAATARARVWNCPTLAFEEISAPDVRADTLARWPELRYISAKGRALWDIARAAHMGSCDPRPVNGAGGTLDALHQLITALQAAGAGILSGTDAGSTPFVLYMMPGFGLHRELDVLVHAGLTPYQALATSTRNVAVYFGTLTESGTVAVGKRADLVLLEANPLVKISNTKRIAGVMHDGRWFGRAELDQRLAALVGLYDE